MNIKRYDIFPVNHQLGNEIESACGRYVMFADAEQLQQRLTAADERNDNRDSEIFAQVQSALWRSFSLGQIYWQQADSDSTCQQNKSDQTMEVQEQHILNVMKSLGVALKPVEVGADSCEFCKGWGFRSNPDGADEGCGACNGTGKEPSDDQP